MGAQVGPVSQYQDNSPWRYAGDIGRGVRDKVLGSVNPAGFPVATAEHMNKRKQEEDKQNERISAANMLMEYVQAQDRQRALDEQKKALWSQWNQLSIGPAQVTPIPNNPVQAFAPAPAAPGPMPMDPGLKTRQ